MAKRGLSELREEMRAVARGERRPSPLPAREMLNVLASAENRTLLQLIHRARPESVARLAALTGRAQPNISRPLQQLSKLGLILLLREGREVRPVPCAATVMISLVDDTYATMPMKVEAPDELTPPARHAYKPAAEQGPRERAPSAVGESP